MRDRSWGGSVVLPDIVFRPITSENLKNSFLHFSPHLANPAPPPLTPWMRRLVSTRPPSALHLCLQRSSFPAGVTHPPSPPPSLSSLPSFLHPLPDPRAVGRSAAAVYGRIGCHLLRASQRRFLSHPLFLLLTKMEAG